MNCHFASAVAPGARLAAAMAPALTIGLVVPSLVRSMASTELKGRPVLLTPSLARTTSSPSASHTSAKTKGLDTLWIENSWSESPAAYVAPEALIMHTPNSSAGVAARAGM